jgi:hypothetical protein
LGIPFPPMWKHFRHAPWGHGHAWAQFIPASGSDHLYNFITAAGAAAAVVGLVVGGIVAVLYSRKATATVSAELHPTRRGTVLAVRPAVHALGPFKLEFAEGDQAPEVRVTPVLATETGTRPDDESARTKPAFPRDVRGNAQFVSPNETLTASRLFRVDPVPEDVVGWVVSLSIASKGFIRRGLNWADEVFVPVAFPPTKGGADEPA